MGLDVSTYSKMELIETVASMDAYEEKYWPGQPDDPPTLLVYGGNQFPEHFVGLTDGGVYRYKEGDSFYAGSYLGYNLWREQLCRSALGIAPEQVWNNAEAYEDKPFFWLIDFSDCEGFIGPEKCARLLQDFEQGSSSTWLPAWDERSQMQYKHWLNAFRLAADNGCVQFH